MHLNMNQPLDTTSKIASPDQGGRSPDTVSLSHSLWAADRKEVTVKGVRDVISFDENVVDLVTSCGRMILEGEGLRVTVLDTAGGVVAIQGKLCGVLYEDADENRPGERSGDGHGKRGRLSRLFR